MAEFIITMVMEWGVWLCRSAIERQSLIRKVMQYLPQRITWWPVLAITAIWWSILEVVSIGFPLMGVMLILMFPFMKKFALRPSMLTIGFWEFILYTHLIGLVVGLGITPFVGLKVDRIAYDLGAAVGWVLNIYLYIEMFAPPRQRKKVKLPSLAPKPAMEFHT